MGMEEHTTRESTSFITGLPVSGYERCVRLFCLVKEVFYEKLAPHPYLSVTIDGIFSSRATPRQGGKSPIFQTWDLGCFPLSHFLTAS